jgi:hypothetical protein
MGTDLKFYLKTDSKSPSPNDSFRSKFGTSRNNSPSKPIHYNLKSLKFVEEDE